MEEIKTSLFEELTQIVNDLEKSVDKFSDEVDELYNDVSKIKQGFNDSI